MLQGQSSGNRDWSHSSRQTKRRDNAHLTGAGKVYQSLCHGPIQHAWGVGIDDRRTIGGSVKIGVAEPKGRLNDLKAFLHLLAAPAVDGHGFISQTKLRLHHRIMAQMHRNVLWLRRGAWFMDDIETLHKAHGVLVARQITGPSAVDRVADIGATATWGEDQLSRRDW